VQGGGERDGLPTLYRIIALYSSTVLTSTAPAPRRPPVVFLTGESDPRLHAQYSAAGADRVVVKPVSLESLKAIGELVLSFRAGHAAQAAS
jgi:CheY-like chemotaxis protein